MIGLANKIFSNFPAGLSSKSIDSTAVRGKRKESSILIPRNNAVLVRMCFCACASGYTIWQREQYIINRPTRTSQYKT